MYLSKSKSFNAVVEGSYVNPWMVSFWRIGCLDIPTSVKVVRERYKSNTYRFSPHSKVSVVVDDGEGPLELEVKSLGSLGVGLATEGEYTADFISHPRALFLRDGRIYVEESVRMQDWYRKAFPDIKKIAEIIFSDPYYQDAYRQALPIWRRVLGL
ncbi:hypothetical protein HYY69_06235 [Candidatus Woesearchaeota archaeon]|nr:hypothetical protein [Candidatus Woesearchaeota archaeon]